LGYEPDSKVYRLYDNKRQKIILYRDVIFDKDKVGFQHHHDKANFYNHFSIDSSTSIESATIEPKK